jgi:uncharacterized protein YaaR (DUF327 family)
VIREEDDDDDDDDNNNNNNNNKNNNNKVMQRMQDIKDEQGKYLVSVPYVADIVAYRVRILKFPKTRPVDCAVSNSLSVFNISSLSIKLFLHILVSV